MSIVFSVLVAAAIIAGLIGLRLFADRAAQRSRARAAHQTHADCGQTGCLRTCDRDRGTGH